jgi:hypothetical protein
VDCLLQANAHERPVIDVLDAATPFVIGKYIEHVSQAERVLYFLRALYYFFLHLSHFQAIWLSNPHLDFMWMCEKIPGLDTDSLLVSKNCEFIRHF